MTGELMPSDILDRLLGALAARLHALAAREMRQGRAPAADPVQGVAEQPPGDPGIHAVLQLLLADVAKPRTRSQAPAVALVKQPLVLLLRRHLGEPAAGASVHAALRDERLARAVIAVLERPAAPHTVESLAAVAGMSRSSFARVFSRGFGEGPIRFVSRVRLRLAAHLLGTTDLPVKLVAASVGYASRSYFSRAFRAAYGVDPTGFRTTTALMGQPPQGLRRNDASLPPRDGGA
jgi:transcriptional regulator GlxA family with amidase domain